MWVILFDKCDSSFSGVVLVDVTSLSSRAATGDFTAGLADTVVGNNLYEYFIRNSTTACDNAYPPGPYRGSGVIKSMAGKSPQGFLNSLNFFRLCLHHGKQVQNVEKQLLRCQG